MGNTLQTPLTDAAVEATYEEADEMKFVLAIYGMEGCKETLDQLFAMTFSDLLSLRQFLEIQRSYKEEIAYNELRRAGKREWHNIQLIASLWNLVSVKR